MTIETLKQCRKAAVDVRKAKKRLLEHKASAGSISGMRYGDAPRGRGEPLAPQEAYMEKLEQLQEELEKCECIWKPLEREVVKATKNLPIITRRLIVGYYAFAGSWEEVNERCGVSRKQWQYKVRKAFEKFLEKA